VTTAATLRGATTDDHDAVARLVSDAGLPTLGLDVAWATVVADDETGLVGVGALERYESPVGPVFLLRSVAVRADGRGTGVGSAVVRAALAAADADAGAVATVALLTETAAGYFDRFGFTEITRGRFHKS
jgi:amino-acid N-acetyltransferase